MITEDYVSFETAKLLKEKGFNEEVICYYDDGGSLNLNKFVEFQCCNEGYGSDVFAAPTLQITMKWLREVHHLYIQVMLDSWACGGHMGYYVVIQNTISDFEMMLQDALDDVFYDTYEEACEAAIKYCLDNLI